MDWGAEAAAAPGKETTEEAGATAAPGTPPAGHTAKSGPGSQAPPAGRGGHRAVSTRQLPQPLSQGCPSPPCPSPPRRPPAGWGLLSPAAHGGWGWAELAHPGRHRDARARASCHVSSAPRPDTAVPNVAQGAGPAPRPPPTRGGPSPPRHSHSGATPAPGRHRTLTRAADTKRRPRVPAMLPPTDTGTDKTAGRRSAAGSARRVYYGCGSQAAARDPRAPGGRGRGRMQQCDTVKRGRGDTGRGRTRGGAQPPTRTGRPGSGKGEKRDSYFL